MQHYLNYGYGFPAKLLTDDEFDRVMQQDYNDVDKGKYSLGCVAFTEGNCERNWSSIVLYNIGEVNQYAKMITLSEFNKTISKHAVISDSRKAKFLELLDTVGLGHYIDKVELIVYSQNC
jgi:hypothetical protein